MLLTVITSLIFSFGKKQILVTNTRISTSGGDKMSAIYHKHNSPSSIIQIKKAQVTESNRR